jgi:asparagine synthase (glutamine-hydrolysing)
MAKVPQDIKIKDGEKKYVLKQIAHTLIPKELLDRPKCGFDIPFSLWLKGPLKELVYDQINQKRVSEDGLFDTDTVLMIRDAFYAGNEAYKYKLWTLFLFQLWYKNMDSYKD